MIAVFLESKNPYFSTACVIAERRSVMSAYVFSIAAAIATQLKLL
jgi:hypothetical protein